MRVYLLLWAIVVLTVVLLFGTREGFGQSCVSLIPYKPVEIKPLKKGTIFVSIASYRDVECNLTVHSLFKNARFPNKVFVGICEQNKLDSESCKTDYVNVRTIGMDYRSAKGPTYARYYCSQLWDGEEYYLQIDSHTTFAKDWDVDLITMITQASNESKRPVLSAYPASVSQMEIPGFPEMDNGRYIGDKLMFICGWSSPSDVPRRSSKPWAAAGFMFLRSDFLYTVPFDPNLSHLFQLEELLFSARLFTNGWDFYAPNKKVLYHNYSRSNSPLYNKDNKNSSGCRLGAEKRALFLLKLLPKSKVPEEFLVDYDKYGVGTFRTMQDFWNASGVNPQSKRIELWNDANLPSNRYRNWNFRLSGYTNIKRWN